ncbi:glycosyltransferase family 4 protein [Streptomyces sp. ID05-04B]|uniref:glycosyltransferase family 4 protein n=1 Tax=unclassified Streptomyces TaxID=2593676 RepID=UPI000D1B7768|nr:MULTISPECIES: glycosyltransferase family 4 protein [unclassified Streptomyces]MDX5565730.1 glycosyltransferase family 4 protein [Streptomyces sp. ID05-04B]
MPGHDRAPGRPGTCDEPAGPLRVVLLASATSVHTRRWADDLAMLGHEVTVCSWHEPEVGSDGRRVASAPGGACPPLRVLRAGHWLRREVRRVRPDVIHVHSLGVHGALSLLLPAHPAVPVVITPWGSELRAAERHSGRALAARLALRRAARVVPTSREVAELVASRYRVPSSRITVLSWGVPDALLDSGNDTDPRWTRAKYGIPADATVALSVRSTSEVYRTHEILAAYTRAARARPDLFLVLVAGHRSAHAAGRRAQQEYLARLRARAQDLAGRVAVIDQPLDQAEMFSLMRASDAAISVPPADQRSSSVLEAAAAGCRLLLSDIAPYREMVTEGLLADLLPEPLVGSLADALSDAGPLDADDRLSNRKLVRQAERGSLKVAELERLYRDAVRAGAV